MCLSQAASLLDLGLYPRFFCFCFFSPESTNQEESKKSRLTLDSSILIQQPRIQITSLDILGNLLARQKPKRIHAVIRIHDQHIRLLRHIQQRVHIGRDPKARRALNVRAAVEIHHDRFKRLSLCPRARVETQVEAIFGPGPCCALGAFVKSRGGVVDGSVGERGGWLRTAEAEVAQGRGGKGDLLPVRDVVSCGIGALEGAVVEGCGEGLGVDGVEDGG